MRLCKAIPQAEKLPGSGYFSTKIENISKKT